MKPNDETEPIARRFVVLQHCDRDGVHFDLMIENGAKLATWKMPDPPERCGPHGQACRRIGEHRRLYLDYEGPISDDRGEVRRHDAGTCRVTIERPRSPTQRWVADFEGTQLRGRWVLEPAEQGDQCRHARPDQWRLRRLEAGRSSG